MCAISIWTESHYAFRIAWLIALPIGATQSLEFVWLLVDTLNAMMAIPNLIALALFSPHRLSSNKKTI